jgi:hypothetical protein
MKLQSRGWKRLKEALDFRWCSRLGRRNEESVTVSVSGFGEGLRRGTFRGEGGGAGSCWSAHTNRHDRYSPNNTREELGRQDAICL